MTYRRKHRRNATMVRVGWMHPETEEDFEVECSVSAGSPEIRWGDNACPADPGEVEILAVADMDGNERPDLLPLVEDDFESIEEKAFEEAGDVKEARAEADADDRYDRMREDRGHEEDY